MAVCVQSYTNVRTAHYFLDYLRIDNATRGNGMP